MFMKISKKIVAVFVGICLLFTIMPAFAATVTKPNASLTLPTDGSSVDIVCEGTGVGSGIIINGKLFTGSNYAGGELGHTVILYEGQQCTCGRKGCFEAYASATALIRQTKEQMKTDSESKMWELVDGDISKVNGRTAFDAMRLGDASAKKVVDQYISYLACGIANVVNTFQPDMVCIGGGISHEGDTLILPLRKSIEADRFSKNLEKQTVIDVARLGNDAGIIGAACLYKNK